MAGTFVVNGANTTVTFSHVKPTAAMQAIINSAAHYLVTDQTIFDGMTNQQKLAVVDDYIRKQVMAIARTSDINAAVIATQTAATATATATATADANVVL